MINADRHPQGQPLALRLSLFIDTHHFKRPSTPEHTVINQLYVAAMKCSLEARLTDNISESVRKPVALEQLHLRPIKGPFISNEAKAIVTVILCDT